VWLLGPSGPIHGHAHVQLTEKSFFLVGKVVRILVERAGYETSIGRRLGADGSAMAEVLYRDGPVVFGRDRWTAFLSAFVELVRTAYRPDAGTSVAEFFALMADLRGSGRLAEILDLARSARSHVRDFRAQLLASPGRIPALDPLVPGILDTVAGWPDHPLWIVHDEQPALNGSRLAQLEALLGGAASLRFVDSRADARIQVADFLAGVARRIAEDALTGQGDAELTELLRPYVDARSVWGDQRSRPALYR
jgi:hypothetical protein